MQTRSAFASASASLFVTVVSRVDLGRLVAAGLELVLTVLVGTRAFFPLGSYL